MAISAGSVYSELILDGSKYFSTLEKAEKQVENFQKKLEKTGKNMEKVGKNLSKYVTAPIVAMGTLSTKAAIDFESAFAGVRKTVDATEEEFAALEKGIRDMSKRMPQSASEIAEVAEAAGQLGIKTENILGFTETMVMLGDATNMSSDQAATALARLANITGMSQTDFDRLGSAIVELGNNLATTESEIVEMGLRLAGTGTQVGLTEDQILALAGAMSSVGINAEAGGSSMSRVMQKMNTEVLSSGKHLQKFAEIAGMSAEEFSKAWRERPQDAILAFVQGLDKINKSGGDVTSTLKDLGINSVQEIDTLLRLAGASDVLTDAFGMSAKAWEENTALTKEAEQRYQTTASQLQIAKNHLRDVAITIGEIVVPHLVNFAEKIKNLAEWFKNLNPETQETIVKLAGLAAAIGPLLIIGGKFANGLGSILELFGKIGPAAGIATKATTALGGEFSLAGLAAKAGALLLNPWTIGIAAATAGGIALAKHLKQDSIPAVNLFSDEVSESTQEAVGSFLDLEEQATTSLNQLAWSGEEVTGEMAESIIGNFEGMKEQVVGKLEEQKESALKSISEMVENSIDMTEEEKEEMIRITGESYDEQIKKTEEGNARIKEILETAKKENRAITEEEKNEINKIKEDMKNDGIRILSESEKEQLAIMERLKQESGKISALQAAEIVKNSKEQKEKTIAEAEEEYTERLKYAAELRAKGTKEAIDMADKIADEAKRQKDEAVKNAEEMHNKVVKEAKEQAKEHVKEVDWETGEVKTKWQVMKTNISDRAKEIRDNVSKRWNETKKKTRDEWSEIETNTKNKWNDIKEKVSTKAKESFENVRDKWRDINKETEEKWSSVFKKTKEKWNDIKEEVRKKTDTIRERIVDSITESESKWSSKTSLMVSTTESKFPTMASAVEGAFSRVVSAIGEGISALLAWNEQKVESKEATFTTVYKEVVAKDGNQTIGKNAHGTNFWKGGLTWVGEQGPELIDLPKGTKVYSNQKSMEMVKGVSGGITQNIHIHSPKPLNPSETARKNLQVSRQLAMEWGL